MPILFGRGDKKKNEQLQEAPVEETEEESSTGAALDESLGDAQATGGEAEIEVASAPVVAPTGGATEPPPRMEFRRAFLDAEEESTSARKADPWPAEPDVQPTYFVVMRDESGDAASFHHCEDARDAAGRVQKALDEGRGEESISVFKGVEIELQVTRRPVVRLVPK